MKKNHMGGVKTRFQWTVMILQSLKNEQITEFNLYPCETDIVISQRFMNKEKLRKFAGILLIVQLIIDHTPNELLMHMWSYNVSICTQLVVFVCQGSIMAFKVKNIDTKI